MFRQRLLTTLVLLPLVLLIIYFAPSLVLASILLLLVALSAWEWTQLIPLQRLDYRLIYILALLFVVWLSSHCSDLWLTMGLIGWLGVLFAEIGYPQSQRYWGYPIVVAGLGLLFLSLFTSVFVHLYQSPNGQNLVVYVMSLVWAADIGAYLAGKNWGQHKLIPSVSPGKTVEGLMGGIALAFVVAVGGYFVFKPDLMGRWFLLALLTVLISIVGDLLISMLKRRSLLKDSGHILPGHGGILDRLDSSIAALPLFYGLLSFLELGR